MDHRPAPAIMASSWLPLALLLYLVCDPTIILTAGAASCDETAGDCLVRPVACCCPTCCRRAGYASVEALILDRDNRINRPIAIRVRDEGNSFPGDTVLSTGDLDFDWEGGVRAVVGRHLDRCQSWEIGYFGVFDWDASATSSGDNDLAIPADLGLASLDFFAADRIRADYDSELHSVEANYVRRAGDLAILGGFRYLSFDERFNLNSTDSDTGSSDYHIETENDLYGGQIGAAYIECLGAIGFGVTGKAGLFGNDSFQRQFVSDFPNVLLRPKQATSGGQVAFVSELNFSLDYRLCESLALRVGYNVIWIEGISLAADQLDFTDFSNSGSALGHSGIFLHGAHVGLTASW